MNSNARMDKKRKWIIGIVVAAIASGVFWKLKGENVSTIQSIERQDEKSTDSSMITSVLALDIKNADYVIGNRKVAIRDGVATEHGSSSASVVKTTILEGTAFADIDGDGKKDAVAILRDEPDKTGIFYYLTVLLANANPPMSTNSILLGDRIRIKEISITEEGIVVSILDRKDGESFQVEPTSSKIFKFNVIEGSLVEAK